jgi:hypothetical protein
LREIRAFAFIAVHECSGVNQTLAVRLSGMPKTRLAEWMSIRGGSGRMRVYVLPMLSVAKRRSTRSIRWGRPAPGAKLNIGYEYGDMKYVDTWSNSASITREFRSAYVADISYAIPW